MKAKKSSLLMLSVAMLGVGTPILSSVPVLANSVTSSYNYSQNKDVNLDLKEQDFARIRLIAKLDKELHLDEEGGIFLSKDYDVLKQEYDLSDGDVATLKVLVDKHNNIMYYEQYQDRLHVRDWHIYLNKGDVQQLGNLLIGLGPAAVAMTLSSFMSVVPGAGTIIGAVVGYFGAATIAGNVAYAAATGRGLKIGLTGISTY